MALKMCDSHTSILAGNRMFVDSVGDNTGNMIVCVHVCDEKGQKCDYVSLCIMTGM